VSDKVGLTSFVDIAMQSARDLSAARQDLPHYIFPSSNLLIDEHLIASVKNSLYMIVFNIERSILREALLSDKISKKSLSYPILMESGLLNNADIIDAALSLYNYHNLILKDGGVQKPLWNNDFLKHNDEKIDTIIHKFSLAQSRFNSLTLGDYYELRPETLHQLIWQIVATFEIIDGEIQTSIIDAANNILSQYDEADTIASSTGKLIYYLRSSNINLDKFWNYKSSYAAIFIALLEYESSLDNRMIMKILNDRSPALSALLFRSVDMDIKTAIDNILYLYSTDKDEVQNNLISQIADEYLFIKKIDAQQILKNLEREMTLNSDVKDMML